MNNQNSQFVAPTGTIQGSFTPPPSTNTREKRNDIRNLPAGLNVGTIYAFVDLGTHSESFQGQAPSDKRKVYLGFEFPQLKQLFYVDDTEVKSTIASKECTLSFGDRSFLTKAINACESRVVPKDELYSYDLSKLIGKNVAITIETTQGKKDPSKYYDKIIAISALGQMQVPQDYQLELQRLFFFIDTDPQGNVIGRNFMTKNFADLPFFIKKKIMESREGIAYAKRGGKFAQNPKVENQNNQQVNTQGQQQNFQQQGQGQQPQHLQQNVQGQQQFQPQNPVQQQNFQQQNVNPVQQQGQQQYNPPINNQPQPGAGFNPNEPDDLPF